VNRLVVCATRLFGLGATAGLSSSARDTVGQANRGTRRLSLDGPFFQLAAAALVFIGLAPVLLGGPPESRVEDVAFVAQCDGTQQKYVVVLPEPFEADRAHDVLIALHGHGSDRWQFVRDLRDECRAARDVAARHGMIFVSPDYRARTSWMGPKAEADLVQIIADLKRQYRVSRVFLCGGSMGGAASLTFAALHLELVDGVASMNGTANLLEYENFQPAIRESFGGTKAEIPLEYKRRSAEYWPERLTMPVGITACGKDTLVPPESVLRLAKVLKAIGRDVLVVFREDGGHSTNYADAEAILEFVIEKGSTRSQCPDSSGLLPEGRVCRIAGPHECGHYKLVAHALREATGDATAGT
jgi:pimeloyl-ACP methyl ester carboxylesterase